MAADAFRNLSRDAQLAAVQLYLGPYARGDAIRRTLAEAAANPVIAESVMMHAPVAEVGPGSAAASQIDAVVAQGDAGSPFAVNQGDSVAPSDAATDPIDDSSMLPWLAAGAAGAAGAGAGYLAARRRNTGTVDDVIDTGEPSSGHTGVSQDPNRPGTANQAPQPDQPRIADQPREGEFIPGDRSQPPATVDPRTGETVYGYTVPNDPQLQADARQDRLPGPDDPARITSVPGETVSDIVRTPLDMPPAQLGLMPRTPLAPATPNRLTPAANSNLLMQMLRRIRP